MDAGTLNYLRNLVYLVDRLPARLPLLEKFTIGYYTVHDGDDRDAIDDSTKELTGRAIDILKELGIKVIVKVRDEPEDPTPGETEGI